MARSKKEEEEFAQGCGCISLVIIGIVIANWDAIVTAIEAFLKFCVILASIVFGIAVVALLVYGLVSEARSAKKSKPTAKSNPPKVRDNTVPITIALLGGPSSGKTQLLMDVATVLIYRVLSELGLTGCASYGYGEKFKELLNMFKTGVEPPLTQNTQEAALCLEVQSSSWFKSFTNGSPKRFQFYDPQGESFRSYRTLSQHRYYEHLSAAIFVLDPSTLDEVIRDYARNGAQFQIPQRGGAAIPPEECLERWLLSMEKDFNGVVSKAICSVVITKTDEPSFTAITGLRSNASDSACREFLQKYGCSNLITTLENTFKEVRFFSAALVGNKTANGSFKPVGVASLVSTTLSRSLSLVQQRRMLRKLLLLSPLLLGVIVSLYGCPKVKVNRPDSKHSVSIQTIEKENPLSSNPVATKKNAPQTIEKQKRLNTDRRSSMTARQNVLDKPRKVICEICRGTGKTTCEACTGSGKVGTKKLIPCPTCRTNADTTTNISHKGLSRIQKIVRCERCQGQGKITGTGWFYSCPQCSGRGEVKKTVMCPTCYGKGSIHKKADCPLCSGKGQIPCKICDGNGSFDKR